jgi:Na+/H+ antiporter NhaD/arsenite permease-like protein
MLAARPALMLLWIAMMQVLAICFYTQPQPPAAPAMNESEILYVISTCLSQKCLRDADLKVEILLAALYVMRSAVSNAHRTNRMCVVANHFS